MDGDQFVGTAINEEKSQTAPTTFLVSTPVGLDSSRWSLAQLQAAVLAEAQLQGAYLRRADFRGVTG